MMSIIVVTVIIIDIIIIIIIIIYTYLEYVIHCFNSSTLIVDAPFKYVRICEGINILLKDGGMTRSNPTCIDTYRYIYLVIQLY